MTDHHHHNHNHHHHSVYDDLHKRMEQAMSILDKELSGLRAGRSSIHLLDPVVVEAYGDKAHISQLGQITTPDSKTVSVQLYDKTILKDVEKSISNANLGGSISTDGNMIYVRFPDLSEERRKEIVKLIEKYGEQIKVVVRNIRRDGMEEVKKLQKDGRLPEDESHKLHDSIQKLTDKFVEKIEEKVKQKSSETMKV